MYVCMYVHTSVSYAYIHSFYYLKINKVMYVYAQAVQVLHRYMKPYDNDLELLIKIICIK